ncbi:D(5)-like dopamine receptor [Cololabis saira]|uniref:D(5)-like dopamine receptor n=1 Tax=Cololabis saira TaxID=129043 RepID=UPI002AD4036E|nr:D(5)-like dopamine receptor [Cololabis saira]
MPWRAVSEVAGVWLFGRFCDTWVAFDIMCSTASILNLCVISMDRYWAISSPFKYERRMTRRFAFLMIGVAWTLSVLISFIPVRLNWHRQAHDDSAPDDPRGCNASLNRTYAISSSLISFYIPVVIMVGTYTRIFRIAQTQIRRISSLEKAAAVPRARCAHSPRRGRGPGRCPGPGRASTHDESSLKTSFKRETKVLKTLSIIMGVFVFCWLPFFVLNCVVPFCGDGEPPCVSDTTFSIFVWFGWANSSLNPVIYAFNADFRRAFSTILGCSRYCSTSTVETVDFSNELVSYHHDTTLQKEAVPRLREPEHNFDKVSVISDDSTNHRNLLLPAMLHFECEREISLDMMPFNSSDPDCYVIPGQIQDL